MKIKGCKAQPTVTKQTETEIGGVKELGNKKSGGENTPHQEKEPG